MTPPNAASRRVLFDAIRAGTLAHTVMLSGPAGSGKLSLILECADRLLRDPYGRALRREHPDLVIYDYGDDVFKVEYARAVRLEAAMSPTEADVRIFVLAHTQNMTPEAQNALLKLLEEPLPSVYFFLLCENESAMLETIRSRCLKLETQPPDEESALAELSKLAPDTDVSVLRRALRDTGGYPQASYALLSRELSDEGRDAATLAANVLDRIRAGDELGLWRILYSRDKLSRDEMTAFLDALSVSILDTLEESVYDPALTRLAALVTEMRELVPKNVHVSHILGLFSQYFVSLKG
ncbi:MAG: hypothetical protein VB111_06630 [Clostridiaceae bacterium]|nr:hypothetical protein [Clostridiaceae bacterium]